MNRREFLGRAGGACAAFSVAPYLASCAAPKPRPPVPPLIDNALDGLPLFDAHAHPNQFYADAPKTVDASSSLDSLVAVGVCGSAFAAVGDLEYVETGGAGGVSEYAKTARQLAKLKAAADAGRIRRIERLTDVPPAVSPGRAPAALFAVEGGDALLGQASLLDDLYRQGVRMLSLVQYRNNELGDTMSALPGAWPGWPNEGLTPAGRSVIARMEALGMVVDVAHLDAKCLKEASGICTKPLVDSHTSPRPEDPEGKLKRLRTWPELEWIAKTGGVVCTWPYAWETEKAHRTSFADWAAEIAEMMRRLGTEHVGLGTDGGGNLPARVEGYADVRDLGRLATAMREQGLSEAQLTAYFGGNFLRVLGKCLKQLPPPKAGG